MKTNAVRKLEELGTEFELREYEVDPDDLSSETVAVKIGMPPEQVFKTLVVRGDAEPVCIAVISGNAELDVKALAKLSGNKRMEMAALKELQPLTGYIRGGVTAIALKRDYPVFVDEAVRNYDRIAVSAGVRGMQIVISPLDYLKVTKASTGEITRPKRE